MKIVATIIFFFLAYTGYCQWSIPIRFLKPSCEDTIPIVMDNFHWCVESPAQASICAVERKYGFRTVYYWNCTKWLGEYARSLDSFSLKYEVYDRLSKEQNRDSLYRRYNDSINLVLERRHGKGWRVQFDAEVDALYKKELKSISLVKKYMVERNTLIKDLDVLRFVVEETEKGNRIRLICYHVNYFSPLTTNVHFSAIVDLDRDTVELEEEINQAYKGFVFYN